MLLVVQKIKHRCPFYSQIIFEQFAKKAIQYFNTYKNFVHFTQYYVLNTNRQIHKQDTVPAFKEENNLEKVLD